MTQKKLIILLFCLFFQASVYAHGDDNWCTDGEISSMAQITVTADELKDNLSNGVNCGIPPENPLNFPRNSSARSIMQLIEPVILTRDHGELDVPSANLPINLQQSYVNEYERVYQSLISVDNVQYASALAYSYCVCATMAGCTAINPDEAKPDLLTPQMTDPNHHNTYKFNNGLTFSCQVCQPSGNSRD